MVHTCDRCEKCFSTPRGLNIHRWHCDKTVIDVNVDNATINASNSNSSILTDIETRDIVNQDELYIEIAVTEESMKPDLPGYIPVNRMPNRPGCGVDPKGFGN